MSTTNYLKTALLLGLLTGLILLVGGLLGGRGGVVIAFAFAVLMNFGTYWFSDKIVLRMHRAQPVTQEQAPRLHAIVERLVARSGLPNRRSTFFPTPPPTLSPPGGIPRTPRWR
jgi:heat shock protein HtpX